MKRGGPLRSRSQKMAALYIHRRKLVASLLEERPWCEVRWDFGCEGRAVDVDEILSRAQGGSILDPDNLQTTCRHCHLQKHHNPAEAQRRGLTFMAGPKGDANPASDEDDQAVRDYLRGAS